MTTEADKKSQQQPEVFELKRQRRGFRVSRRDFLKVTGSGIAAAAFSSCAQPEAGETPTDTETPTPTPTRTPTPTKTRTPTPTPTKIPVTASVRNQGARLRQSPSTETLVIGALSIHVVVIVMGKLADASWLQVQVNLTDLPALKDAPVAKQGTTVVGWMRVDLLEILSGSLDDVPAVESPPTPTPLPNERPTGKDGITYKYTDLYGNTYTYTLPCGAPIPAGAVCTCNCVSLCSCVSYVAPTCSCDKHKGGGSVCTCDLVTYWYPN
jgi:TAT (twin-arginine translocation) pathway signal sequence